VSPMTYRARAWIWLALAAAPLLRCHPAALLGSAEIGHQGREVARVTLEDVHSEDAARRGAGDGICASPRSADHGAADHRLGCQPMVLRPRWFMTQLHDAPGFVAAFLELFEGVAAWQAELALEAGVDVLQRRGWYDEPAFWGGAHFPRYLQPSVNREARYSETGERT